MQHKHNTSTTKKIREELSYDPITGQLKPANRASEITELLKALPDKNSLTQALLQEILAYDRNSGEFIWLVSLSRRTPVGLLSSYVDSSGYQQIRIGRRGYFAHRLAWLYTYGCWPKKNLDHIDGNPSNNRIGNLREASHLENCQNLGLSKRNRTGLLGVSQLKTGEFAAGIKVNNKSHNLGLYKTPEEAHAAYKKAKAVFHQFQPTIPERAYVGE